MLAAMVNGDCASLQGIASCQVRHWRRVVAAVHFLSHAGRPAALLRASSPGPHCAVDDPLQRLRRVGRRCPAAWANLVATAPTAASQAACTRCIGVVDSSCSSCDGCTQFVLCQARQHPPAPLRAAPGLCRAQPRPASSRGTKCEPRSDTPLRACRGWSDRRRSFCNLVHPSMQPATAMLAQASLRQAWEAKQVRT